MKIGDRVKDNNGEIWLIFSILQHDVFLIRPLYSDSKWVGIIDFNANYTKVDDDTQLDWTKYTAPTGGTYQIGNGTITLPEGYQVDLTAFDAKDRCYHDWKQYTGFTESYEYCAKCDKKKVN